VKTFQRDLSGYDSFRARPVHFHLHRHCPTMENTVRYKPEVETVPQTGSTNNLATETDIDAISMAISMFWGGKFFTDLYANLTRRFFHSEIQDEERIAEVVIIWRRKTINVISAAAAMFSTGIDTVRLWRTPSGRNRK